MANPSINATLREKSGKGAARSARREGLVPGVVYGAKKEPIMINVNGNELLKMLRAGHFMSHLMTVKVDGKSEQVLCRDVQKNLINGLPTHIDFMRVTRNQRVDVWVQVVFHNEEECAGVKQGGSLVVTRPEVEMNVPVIAIPEQIELDLTPFEIGDVIHISNFVLPEGCTPVIDDRDFVVANISAPMEEETEEEDEVEAGDVPTTGEDEDEDDDEKGEKDDD